MTGSWVLESFPSRTISSLVQRSSMPQPEAGLRCRIAERRQS
ncbi:hypothetical protein I549_0706 [Mycobacterium avium subsp. avium 2285 (R)]|nr:hypothetical protein I549_0706 [Mycobacterium avium subsp. avium 2285 (R)]